MSVDRAFSQGEISFNPTTTELHDLANDCEGLAEAHLAAKSKIASLRSISHEDNLTLRPGTSKIASRWTLSGPLPRLELAVSPNTEASHHFHDAIKCKLYIPFNMLTSEHLETTAVTSSMLRETCLNHSGKKLTATSFQLSKMRAGRNWLTCFVTGTPFFRHHNENHQIRGRKSAPVRLGSR